MTRARASNGKMIRLPSPKCCARTKRTRNYGATFFAVPTNARGYVLRTCPACNRPAVYVYLPGEPRVVYLGSVLVRGNATRLAMFARGLLEAEGDAAAAVEAWAAGHARLCTWGYLELWRELYAYVCARIHGGGS